MVPTLPVGMTIDKAMEDNPDLRNVYDSEPYIKRLVDAAKSIEGVSRHASTHAAGVVVSATPLTETVPLQKATKGEDLAMAQYSMKMLEKVGLLKMDFLGLNNLTIVANTVRELATTRAMQMELSSIPLDDAETFKMLGEGETTGVFQLEGGGMRRWVRELKPNTVRHLMAIVALYRPGPMAYIPTYIARKEGREPVEYIHPALEPILKETYGVIVYQDQVIKGVVAAAGFSMGQADVLRNAMSKKIRDVMAEQKGLFMEGAQKNGISAEGAATIWEQIEPFAGYAFNKAHAACYALLAYQTAYLKTHYPVEYMTALCTSYVADTDKISLTLAECKRLGVQVLPPHINKSQLQFSVEPLKGAGSPLKPTDRSKGQLAMRFGLIGVKNVGEGAILSMIEEREKNGPFRSLSDFCKRVDTKSINKRVIESLIKCGAMDELGERAQLLADLDCTLDAAQQEQRAAEIGQITMFDSMFGMAAAPTGTSSTCFTSSVPAASQKDKLTWEKEILGLYITSHPFQHAAPWLQGRATATSAQLGEEGDGKKVVIAGVIASVKLLTTKKGDRMLAAQMEDLHGSLEVVVFPKTYERTRDIWQPDAVVVVEGKVDAKDDRKKVLCEKAEVFVVPEGEAPPMEEMAPIGGDAPDSEFGEPPDGYDSPDEEPGVPWEALVGAGDAGMERGPLPEGEGQGEGVVGGEARLPSPRPSPTTVGEGVPAASQSSARNGNGNGYHTNGNGQNGPRNGNGNGSKATNGRARCHLLITINRRGTDDDDLALLRDVCRNLSAWQGQDSYELCIVTGCSRVYLETDATTNFVPQLEVALKDLLGHDCVTVC